MASLTDLTSGDFKKEYEEASFTATNKRNHLVNTIENAITATLPASPVDGNEIELTDVSSAFSVNNLTVDGGSVDVDLGGTTKVLNDPGNKYKFRYIPSFKKATKEKALLLNGTDEYVYSNDLFNATDYAMSAWVKIGSTSSTYKIVTLAPINTTVNGQKEQAEMYWDGSSNELGIKVLSPNSQSDELESNAVNIEDNAWHHVVVAFDQSAVEAKIYIDGTLRNTGNVTYDSGASAQFRPSIGTNGNPNTLPGPQAVIDGFAGQIKHVSIWNKYVTDADVTEMYNSGSPPDLSSHTNYANCRQWLKLDGDITEEVQSTGWASNGIDISNYVVDSTTYSDVNTWKLIEKERIDKTLSGSHLRKLRTSGTVATGAGTDTTILNLQDARGLIKYIQIGSSTSAVALDTIKITVDDEAEFDIDLSANSGLNVNETSSHAVSTIQVNQRFFDSFTVKVNTDVATEVALFYEVED